MLKGVYRIIYIWALALFIISAASIINVWAATISATVKITVCGDGIVASPEECDGSNLSGASCATQGFASGSLSCSPTCEFDTSSCTMSSGSSGGGGGGGGGSSSVSPPITSVVFKGRSYPGSTVALLKDAQLAAVTVAGPDAEFSIALSGLSAGSYIFSLHSKDKNEIRSPLQTFLITVTNGVSTNISGIFFPPTIALDKSEVRRGDNLTIFGQSSPGSEVTVSVNSNKEFFLKKTADAEGVYLASFDTSVLEIGQHQTKSKSALNGEITTFSKVASFVVGLKNIPANLSKVIAVTGDMNGDSRVNLVDFSITAYWYKRPNPPASADLNSDGKVDLVDFSIMAFNWTG